MPGLNLRPLREDEFPSVHAAFLEAFSDYAVPLQLSEDDLHEMVTRRGYLPAASVGVFDGSRLVAFTLNGAGDWNGTRTGYDTGTGVVPSHRSQGLSKRMIDAAVDLLRAHGAVQYLLEVLQTNARARGVYERAGFTVTRELQCWGYEGGEGLAGRARASTSLASEEVRTFFDIAPSWQNSLDSIARARSPRKVFEVRHTGALLGCAVLFPNGDVPFVAVRPDARRQGIGRELLAAAAGDAGRPLRIINVEAGYAAGEAFLESCGAIRTVRQFEMMLSL